MKRFTLLALLATAAGATAARAQDLFVAGYDTNNILEFSPTGAFRGALSGGGLANPIGIAFDAGGNLYASSSSTNSVLRYNRNTGAFTTFASGGGLSGPSYLTFGPDNNLYVASANTGQIDRFNGATGAFMNVFATGGGLSTPNGLVFSGGNLFVGDSNAGAVFRYNGGTGAIFGSGGSLTNATFFTLNSGNDSPYGLAAGPGGTLFVSDFTSGSVLRFNAADGSPLGAFASGNGLLNPDGLAFDSLGNLYVAETNSPGKVLEFNSGGSFLRAFASGNGMSIPSGLAFGPQVVPEPGSVVCLLAGGGALLGFAAFRRSRVRPA